MTHLIADSLAGTQKLSTCCQDDESGRAARSPAHTYRKLLTKLCSNTMRSQRVLQASAQAAQRAYGDPIWASQFAALSAATSTAWTSWQQCVRSATAAEQSATHEAHHKRAACSSASCHEHQAGSTDQGTARLHTHVAASLLAAHTQCAFTSPMQPQLAAVSVHIVDSGSSRCLHTHRRAYSSDVNSLPELSASLQPDKGPWKRYVDGLKQGKLRRDERQVETMKILQKLYLELAALHPHPRKSKPSNLVVLDSVSERKHTSWCTPVLSL